ncbi:hypothetical protein GCM10007424_22310 [Flavobacterium suaedae]|uniref:DUF748 domain-containing protein n=1 Tax=Flavobacterium suaedae TaxID=1767027 RepID=A0ABQ1K192_9FLAO|nr:hypothetical protein [Flavobacterium suaedae]GGB81757.1 hypothetical protein GCM10007424_22310 [Flavobacterium suaedae]
MPKLIEDKKDIPYNITYKDADVLLYSGNITFHDAYITPKDSGTNELKKGAFCKVKKIAVKGIGIWSILFGDEISANSVKITKPTVMLYQQTKQDTVKEESKKPFKKLITTKTVKIENGNFMLLDTLQKPKANIKGISFSMNDIAIDSNSMKNKIPLRYKNYNLECDSIFYHASKFYNLTAANLKTTDTSFVADNFKMIPLQKRMEFNSMLTVEKDQFTVKAKQIALPNVKWGFKDDTLFVHSPKVILNEVDANIYRGKMVADDFSTKKLYSQMLRELDFDLKIDEVELKDSKIVYEEQRTYEKPPGKLEFSKFYASIYNLYSPINKQEHPETQIDVKCNFMEVTPLKVNWTFNITDESDKFTIKGNLGSINTKNLNSISAPLMNATTSGNIKNVVFTFHGNREQSHGSFAMNYNNLEVNFLKKESKEENGFLSFVGNLAVKNNSNGELKQTDVTASRVKYKSTFNFLWRFINQGLKQTVLPEILHGVGKK